MIISTNWYKCHGKGWTGIITPESFVHPAKFSRALIRRIYRHALEQGYIAPGALVLDPFGGVALGALHAMQNGLHWVGMELEEKFVGLGRDNIALWNRRYSKLLPGWGTARLLQGDSRRLAEVLGAAAGLVASPPYAETHVRNDADFTDEKIQAAKASGLTKQKHEWGRNLSSGQDHYGTAPGQLGALSPGNHAAVIASPPWEQSLSRDTVDKADRVALARELGIADCSNVSSIDMEKIGKRTQEYGSTPGQMGNMPPGDLPAVVLGSPPHGSNAAHGRSGPIDAGMFERQPGEDGQTFACEDYGGTPGQMGGMVLGSPPHADARIAQEGGGNENNMRRSTDTGRYGKQPGQLAEMVIGSPPFIGTLASDDPDKRGGLFRDPKMRSRTLTAEYGNEPGQLGTMKAGALMSSPPYEGALSLKGGRQRAIANNDASKAGFGDSPNQGVAYSAAPDNLGNQVADTFWQAAHTIMSQCYQILAPGSVAIWALKAFVRNKAIVDFPGQWQALGEACGFETVEVIRAWLVEDRGNATALFDFDVETKQKDGSVDVQTIERGDVRHATKKEVKSASLKRASFFRNLYEKKYPGNEIDFEIVLIQRRPL